MTESTAHDCRLTALSINHNDCVRLWVPVCVCAHIHVSLVSFLRLTIGYEEHSFCPSDLGNANGLTKQFAGKWGIEEPFHSLSSLSAYISAPLFPISWEDMFIDVGDFHSNVSCEGEKTLQKNIRLSTDSIHESAYNQIWYWILLFKIRFWPIASIWQKISMFSTACLYCYTALHVRETKKPTLLKKTSTVIKTFSFSSDFFSEHEAVLLSLCPQSSLPDPLLLFHHLASKITRCDSNWDGLGWVGPESDGKAASRCSAPLGAP